MGTSLREFSVLFAAALLAGCAGNTTARRDDRLEPRTMIRQHVLQGARRVLNGTYTECYRAAARALDLTAYYSVTRDYAAVYADEFHGMSAVGVFLRQTGRDDRTQVEVLYAHENMASFEPSRRRLAEESLLDDVERSLRVVRGEAEAPPRSSLDRARMRGMPQSEVDSAEGLPQRRQPLDTALVIGVERHAALGDADYATRDAEVFRLYAETLLGVPRENVLSLSDRHATRDNIFAAVAHLQQISQPGSRVWVFFSGAGASDPERGTPYLVTWESEPRYWSTTALPLDEFFRSLEDVPALEMVVILDASFSGYGDRTWSDAPFKPVFTERRPELPRSSNLTVLYAAAPGETAFALDHQGHGLFTYELLRGLGAAAGRPGSRLDDVMRGVWRAVRATSLTLGKAQNPAATGSGRSIELW